MRLRRTRPRHAEQGAVEVEQAGAGVVVGKAVVLGQIADAAAHADGAGRLAEQLALPSVGLGDAEQDLDERRLAGAVLAEQAEDFAALDGQRHALEGLDLAELFDEVFGGDYGHDGIPRRRNSTPQHRLATRPDSGQWSGTVRIVAQAGDSGDARRPPLLARPLPRGDGDPFQGGPIDVRTGAGVSEGASGHDLAPAGSPSRISWSSSGVVRSSQALPSPGLARMKGRRCPRVAGQNSWVGKVGCGLNREGRPRWRWSAGPCCGNI